MRSVCLCAAAAVVLGTGARAQSGPDSPAFEAASVRLHQATASPQVPEMRNGPLVVSSSLIRLTGYTVFGLVMDAWDLRAFQVAPAREVRMEDIADTTYDIVARAPGEGVPSMDAVRAMLRALLEERFQLKVHHESKEMPVYSLVTSRSGPRLKANAGASPCSVRARPADDGRNLEETFTNCGMERFVDVLNAHMQDRPVLDRTGLRGAYDFRLVAAPYYRRGGHPDPADIEPAVALGKLGLRLVVGKAQVDVLVIDHLEKPGENE